MRRETSTYYIQNFTVLFLTAAAFLFRYWNVGALFAGRDLRHVCIMIPAVCLVHIMKAARMYLALYGFQIELVPYLKIYCRVTPVSVVLPFKLGEFFRMYSYGQPLQNLTKGTVLVLLDRFMDTAALLASILLVWLFNGGRITRLAYLMLLFLAAAVMAYYVFPGVCRFWKHFLLREKATENRLQVLHLLDVLSGIYTEIVNVNRGRGILLFVMSLIAWLIEIGSLALVNGITPGGELSQVITDYLSAAIGVGRSADLTLFVFISVVITSILYVVIKAKEILSGMRDAEK